MSNSLKIIDEENPWYAKGLRFKCTECGKCCTGSPGYVWVSEEEIKQIATYLNLSIKEFTMRYVRKVDKRFSLTECKESYDCVFLKEKKKCQIYPVRPKQCRTFPFWTQHLKNDREWKEAATFCEGINADAPIISYEIIKEQLAIYEEK